MDDFENPSLTQPCASVSSLETAFSGLWFVCTWEAESVGCQPSNAGSSFPVSEQSILKSTRESHTSIIGLFRDTEMSWKQSSQPCLCQHSGYEAYLTCIFSTLILLGMCGFVCMFLLPPPPPATQALTINPSLFCINKLCDQPFKMSNDLTDGF